MIVLLTFAVVIAVWGVAIVADMLADRRPRFPERWAVHTPGRFPAYVR